MAWPIIYLPLSRELILVILIKPTLNLAWTGSQHNSNVTVSCVIFQRFSHVLSFFSFAKEKITLHPIPLALLKEGQNHISLGYSEKTLLKSQTRLVPLWSSYFGVFPAGIHMPLPLQGLNRIMWKIAFLTTKEKKKLHNTQDKPLKTFHLHFALGPIVKV